MPFSKNVLAFDFGASSGRAMIGSFDGEKIALEEKHRFSNDPVFLNDTLFWDTPRQIYEIKQGILKCGKNAAIESIGIDTWGVDFGLIDKNGYLLENHVHYRDTRTRGQIGEVAKIVPRSELYARTGIQFEEFNTIYQLYSLVKSRPELIERVQSLLLTPDLFNYFLTGEKRTEYTIASTTQLLDVNARSWDFDLIDRLNIPRGIFTGIIEPGSISGRLSESVCSELNVQSANVISVASHDTASAVVAVPATGDDFVFLSSGTWSVLGIESDRPILTKASLERDFSNEGGTAEKSYILKTS
jgi:rhamnulokinase/L-fuculokinase